MNKPTWIKKSFVIFCLLASGVATQVSYNTQFNWRAIASDDPSGIITFDEAVDAGEADVLEVMGEETAIVTEVEPQLSEVSIAIETSNIQDDQIESTENVTSVTTETEVTEVEENNDELVAKRHNFAAAKEQILGLKGDFDSLIIDFETYFSKIENKETSSKEIQALIDHDLVKLNERLNTMYAAQRKLSELVHDESKLAEDMTDEEKDLLQTLLQTSFKDAHSFQVDHVTAIYNPEDFVRDAKLKEHGENLTSIQASLCEQKQEVSSLVERIENLIAKKEEIVEEAEENIDEEGEEDVADSVEDRITAQSEQIAAMQLQMQNFTAMTLPSPSPYTMFPNPYSMYGQGYGQGIGGFSPYFPMTAQRYPGSGFNTQPSYLSNYYGLDTNRAPSSYNTFGTLAGSFDGSFRASEGLTLPNNQLNRATVGINGKPIQFGNDFTANTSLANPSYQIKIPSYSRSMITSTPFEL